MRYKDKTTTILLFLFIIMLVSGGRAFCGWEIQKHAGETNINNIAFVDELHGWAVGDRSLILATVDGGETRVAVNDRWEIYICLTMILLSDKYYSNSKLLLRRIDLLYLSHE